MFTDSCPSPGEFAQSPCYAVTTGSTTKKTPSAPENNFFGDLTSQQSSLRMIEKANTIGAALTAAAAAAAAAAVSANVAVQAHTHGEVRRMYACTYLCACA